MEKGLYLERPFCLTVGFTGGYDSNVIAKPVDASVAGDITDEGATVLNSSVRVDYIPKLTGPWFFNANYTFNSKLHSRFSTTHDNMANTISLTPGYSFGRSAVSLMASYTNALIRTDPDLFPTSDASPGYKRYMDDTHFGTLTLHYQAKGVGGAYSLAGTGGIVLNPLDAKSYLNPPSISGPPSLSTNSRFGVETPPGSATLVHLLGRSGLADQSVWRNSVGGMNFEGTVVGFKQKDINSGTGGNFSYQGNLFHKLNLDTGRDSPPWPPSAYPADSSIGVTSVPGAWMNLSQALTGVSGGQLYSQDPAGGWQAVAAGGWIETGRFMGMLGSSTLTNFNKRLIKAPKLYFFDVGSAAWLLGIHTPEEIRFHAQRGAIFETFVVTGIIRDSALVFISH